MDLVAPFFDPVFYKATGSRLPPGADPLVHFLTVGWGEGRDPNPTFSTQGYLRAYPDVAAARINPFIHYLRWGKAESRPVQPSQHASRITPELVRQKQAIAAHFDAAHYLEQPGAGQQFGDDPVLDYLVSGWRFGLDPSPAFSTSYYLDHYADIREGGINPFVHFIEHGRSENRQAVPFARRVAKKEMRPLVSVVVPNYNHARFLDERLHSILAQTYRNLEVIVLDDCSTDQSLQVIRKYRKDPRVRVIENKRNSGSVFAQWRRGIEAAQGDLVWICESDDFCELDFLDKLMPEFADDSVMIAFGRIQFAQENGKLQAGLDDYRNAAEPGIWDARVSRPAAQWFRGAFAVANVIPNVGGCVFRRQPIHPSVWERLLKYRICGDWFLYCMLAVGGRISYVPQAVAYFRQHGKNTSVKSFTGADYYREHEMLMVELRRVWEPGREVVERFSGRVHAQYEYAKAASSIGPLSAHFSKERVLDAHRSTRHILMAFLGFSLGGGELMPIHLANELIARGYLVSMLCVDSSEHNPRIRAMLDRRVAVYDAQLVSELGVREFIRDAGVDLIHSHTVAAEYFFFKDMALGVPPVPYMSSLHGSYECTPVDDPLLMKILRGVKHWVYLTEKNLGHLHDVPIDRTVTSRIPNGMPSDPRPAPATRKQLGIGETDLVFAIASRALKEKGWAIAADALALAQKRVRPKLHLLLCGTGPEEEALRARKQKNVHVMGYVEAINGVYRMSDAVLLPTRFAGESFPLSLIQALQEGKPVISTDIGEIRGMIEATGSAAGIVLENQASDADYTRALADAMVTMADGRKRAAWAETARNLGGKYDMAKVADQFVALYLSLVDQPAASRKLRAQLRLAA